MDMYIKNLILKLKLINAQIEAHSEYSELLSNFPHLKNKTIFEALTSLPDMILIEYPYLLQVNSTLKESFLEASTLFEKINGSHIEKIKTLLDLNNSHSIEIDTLHFNGDEKEADLIANYISECTTLIPMKYHKNIKLNYFITKMKLDSFTSFDVKNQTNIIISSSQNDEQFGSQLMHEIGHVIEELNPSLKVKSIDFLKNKATSDSLEELSAFSMTEDEVNIKVLPGRFIEPYIGRIYGSLNQIENTEVISVGLQALFLNPVVFLFKDVDHFSLIYDLLKGEHE